VKFEAKNDSLKVGV